MPKDDTSPTDDALISFVEQNIKGAEVRVRKRMWRLVWGAIPIVVFLALILFIHDHPGGTITTGLAAIGALSISLGLYWYISLFG